MMARCYSPRATGWKRYGGRGIKVCERWHTFENFRDDVGVHPGKGWSLDRPKNNEDYGPNNWRWATPKMQARNTRATKLTAANAEDIRRRYVKGNRWDGRSNLSALAHEFGVGKPQIYKVAHGKEWT